MEYTYNLSNDLFEWDELMCIQTTSVLAVQRLEISTATLSNSMGSIYKLVFQGYRKPSYCNVIIVKFSIEKKKNEEICFGSIPANYYGVQQKK